MKMGDGDFFHIEEIVAWARENDVAGFHSIQWVWKAKGKTGVNFSSPDIEEVIKETGNKNPEGFMEAEVHFNRPEVAN